jgi:hypothetical protein
LLEGEEQMEYDLRTGTPSMVNSKLMYCPARYSKVEERSTGTSKVRTTASAVLRSIAETFKE